MRETVMHIAEEIGVVINETTADRAQEVATIMFNNGGGKWKECVECVLMQIEERRERHRMAGGEIRYEQ